jgi:ribosome-binding factor A
MESQMSVELDAVITSLEDPRIELVSVTDVDLAKDMRHARVYVSGLGADTDREAILQGLNSAKAFIRRQLSSRMPHLQRTPDLTFDYDESIERGMRIEKLLEQLHDEQEQ